jgi:hypothetical protein
MLQSVFVDSDDLCDSLDFRRENVAVASEAFGYILVILPLFLVRLSISGCGGW